MRVKQVTQSGGRYEARLSDVSDWNVFRSIADTMVDEFDGNVIERLDGLDRRYWDIEIRGSVLTLHLEQFMGISLYSRDERADAIITEVVKYLETAEADSSQSWMADS